MNLSMRLLVHNVRYNVQYIRNYSSIFMQQFSNSAADGGKYCTVVLDALV